jgi:hypothetical protein
LIEKESLQVKWYDNEFCRITDKDADRQD